MSLFPTEEQKAQQSGYEKGYAAGAKAERERFADELKKDLESRFVPSSNEWSKGRNSGLIECCNIIDESLKAQQKKE